MPLNKQSINYLKYMSRIKFFILVFVALSLQGCVRVKADYIISLSARIENDLQQSVEVYFQSRGATPDRIVEESVILLPGENVVIASAEAWSTKKVDFEESPDSFYWLSTDLVSEMPFYMKFIYEDGTVYEFFQHVEQEDNPLHLSSYTLNDDMGTFYYYID